MQFATLLTFIFATLAAASPTVPVPDGCANGVPGGVMARVPVPHDARVRSLPLANASIENLTLTLSRQSPSVRHPNIQVSDDSV